MVEITPLFYLENTIEEVDALIRSLDRGLDSLDS